LQYTFYEFSAFLENFGGATFVKDIDSFCKKIENMMIKKGVIILLLFILALSACKKNDKNSYVDYNTLLYASSDYLNVQQMTVRLLNTYFKMATDSVLYADGYNPDIDKAACNYFKDTILDTVYYEIIYGDWGVIDPYRRRRGGKIKVHLDGDFEDSLTTANFEFLNFHYEFDTLKVLSFTVQNLGKTDGQNTLFHLKIDNMQWQIDTTGAIRWNSDQYFLRKKSGNSIYFNNNNAYLITGTVDGTTARGEAFSANITDGVSLKDIQNCAWPKDGPVSFSIADFNKAEIYFPSDTLCANQCLLTLDGNNFVLPIEHFK